MSEIIKARAAQASEPTQPKSQAGHQRASNWRQDLRALVVRRGIEAIWGPSAALPETAASGIPIVSAGLRLAWLRAVGLAGVRDFVTASGLGYDFVCHVGDLAEYPFYHRQAFREELALCAAWLDHETKPIVYDIGANVGFFATQLVQMLARQSPEIYAFEPVPNTFAKLVRSVERLGLSERVHPIAAAVVDQAQLVRISYSPKNSLYAQITPKVRNPRVGTSVAHALGVTVDGFQALLGSHPALLKIDVEGSEPAVLRGAGQLLARPDRPAIMFEFNPMTLSECGESVHSLRDLLSGYALNYVDDLEGQKMPFGAQVGALEDVHWICNLFAVPLGEGAADRWEAALGSAQRRCAALAKGMPAAA